MDNLNDRVEQLQVDCLRLGNELRRWRRACVGALVAITSLLFMGAHFSQIPKVVEAERFVLRDKAGKIRADLSISAEDLVGLVLFDREEKQRVGMAVYPDRTASFKLFSDSEGTRMSMFMTKDGSGATYFYHEEKPKVVVGMNSDGTPTLDLSDKDGKALLQVPKP
jgi:hypothetical protein